MFGYVRPARSQLTESEWEAYQAVYCGLCHTLKRRCGLAARFILNYDFVFLFLLLDGEGGGCRTRRCPVHPLGGRTCLEGTGAMELCAWESVILAYYQLADAVADGGVWKRTLSRLARLLLKGAYQRALGQCHDFDHQVCMCLWELDELERANSPQLDRVADTFARLLAAAAPSTGEEKLDRPRRQLLYHVGRWIYLIDGWDDRAEDEARGRYNPLTARFGGAPDAEYVAATMTHSLNLARSAFELLPRTRWSPILENILYLGLPQVQALVLAGKWNHNEDRDRSKHP